MSTNVHNTRGFPGGSAGIKNPPAKWETWVRSLGWEDPLEKGTVTHCSILAWRIPWIVYPWGHKELDMTELLSGEGTPLQYFCLENPMDGGAWWAAVHGVAQSWTGLSGFTFTFHFHALEKAMANPLQCSCLENPGDGGAWGAAVYGVAQSRTRLKRLSSSSSRATFTCIHVDKHHVIFFTRKWRHVMIMLCNLL